MILSGRDLSWYIERGLLKIEPRNGATLRENGADLILESVKVKTPLFALGSTLERLTVPDDLMAFVELRSTWARLGFMLPPTIVDAGFDGTLTLELWTAGVVDFPIGERFAHIVFARLTSPGVPYQGRYQGQRGITEALREGRG